MTLDATKPNDQTLVSELPKYIRDNRNAINAFASGNAEYTTTSTTLSSGTDTLVVGTDIADIDMEIILLRASGACTLERILGGRAGQIKIFVMEDNDISFKDGDKTDGKFYLNQLPNLSTYNALQGDSIAFVNIDGDGSLNNGYWKEFNRQESVKS